MKVEHRKTISVSEKQVFIADDGTEFDSEVNCINHENKNQKGCDFCTNDNIDLSDIIYIRIDLVGATRYYRICNSCFKNIILKNIKQERNTNG